jgi:hypothetical protein
MTTAKGVGTAADVDAKTGVETDRQTADGRKPGGQCYEVRGRKEV